MCVFFLCVFFRQSSKQADMSKLNEELAKVTSGLYSVFPVVVVVVAMDM